MINPERMLGGLLRGAMGGRMPSGTRVALGMGALGIAVAAFDHYMQQRQSGPAQPGAMPPPPPPLMPRAPAIPGPVSAAAPPPPPVPPAADFSSHTLSLGPQPAATVPAPGALPDARDTTTATPVAAASALTDQAMLLVGAMIAAAGADGVFDDDERHRIVDRLAATGLDDDERSFLDRQLAAPPRLEALLARITSPQLAEQFYLASLLAIRVDSDVERGYLRRLAGLLALDDTTVRRLHTMIASPIWW